MTIEGDPELLRGNHAFDYQYLNDHTDRYFNLSGVTYSPSSFHLGSANVGSTGSPQGNFYATTYGYDDNGNQDRVQNPNSTITRTVYEADALDQQIIENGGTPR